MKATAKLGPRGFRTVIRAGDSLEHEFISDEPEEKGGANEGPTAMALLASALAACTAATLRAYANHKGLPLEGVEVEVEAVRRTPSEQNEAGPDARATLVRKQITIQGKYLTEEQKERMLQVAEKCPVNRALKEGVDFAS
jgi:putative redox protein